MGLKMPPLDGLPEPGPEGFSSAKIKAGDHFNRRHTFEYSED
jgi:hypothetical protein